MRSERGVDLSPQTTLLPNVGDNVKRKLIQLDLADLRLKYGFSHVIFNLPKNFPKVGFWKFLLKKTLNV